MSEAIDEVKEGVEPRITRLDLMRPIVEDIVLGRRKLSYSAISNFIDSPKDFSDYKLRAKVETPAMIYGSMVHVLVLEPKEFESRYYTIDDSDIVEALRAEGSKNPRATNKYKEWLSFAEEGANGRIIVAPKDYAHAKVVAYNVRTNRASARLLAACPLREQKVEWQFLNFGWQGVIDMEGETDIADLKTMPDANREKVDREIKRRRLYLQAVMYGMGSMSRDLKPGEILEYLVANDKKKKHVIAVDKLGGISVHTMHNRLLEYGLEELTHYTKLFNYCYTIEGWDMSQDFYGHPWNGAFVCEKSGYMLNAEF
jgi:hypothetical protein